MDIKEYDRIVREYRKQLFRYCYYRLYENMILTEETFDNIILTLYKKWDTINFDANVKAWLYGVADLEIKQTLKKHNRYYDRNVSLDEILENGGGDIGEQYDEYFTDEDFREDEYIERLRDSLPDEYREIFTLRYIRRETLTEISSKTGIPYSSLRLRISKLDRLIRELVKKMFN